MPKFCKPHAKSIHEIQQFPCNPIIFWINQVNLGSASYKLHDPTDIIMYGRESTKIIDIMNLI